MTAPGHTPLTHRARVPRPKRDEVRRSVVEGAFEAFRERGFMGASIDFICAKSGLSRGAFYSNFRDKDELFYALYERQTNAIMERIQRALDDVAGNADPLTMLRAVLAEQDPDDLAWDIISREFILHALRNEAARGHLVGLRAQMRAFVADALREVFARLGKGEPDDVDEWARVVIALHEGDRTQILLEREARAGHSLEARFLPVLLTGHD